MSQNEFANIGVIKVAMDPELFWIALTNPREPKTPGIFMQTSGNLNEDELRLQLRKAGLGELQAIELVEGAREKFKMRRVASHQ